MMSERCIFASRASPPLACLLTNSLQIQQFRYLVARHRSCFRTQAYERWKMTDASMKFSQQHKCRWCIAWWVNKQRAGLPLFGGEANGVYNGCGLWFE